MSHSIESANRRPTRWTFALLLLVMLVGVPAVQAQMRVWRDFTGARLEAEFVAGDDTSVTVRLHDGRFLRIPLTSLSAEDRTYAEGKVDATTPRYTVNAKATWDLRALKDVTLLPRGSATVHRVDEAGNVERTAIATVNFQVYQEGDADSQSYYTSIDVKNLKVSPGDTLEFVLSVKFSGGGVSDIYESHALSKPLESAGEGRLEAGTARFSVTQETLQERTMTRSGDTARRTRTDWTRPRTEDAPPGLPAQLLPPGEAADAAAVAEDAGRNRPAQPDPDMGDVIQGDAPPGLPAAWR